MEAMKKFKLSEGMTRNYANYATVLDWILTVFKVISQF